MYFLFHRYLVHNPHAIVVIPGYRVHQAEVSQLYCTLELTSAARWTIPPPHTAHPCFLPVSPAAHFSKHAASFRSSVPQFDLRVKDAAIGWKTYAPHQQVCHTHHRSTGHHLVISISSSPDPPSLSESSLKVSTASSQS